jgi:hypothetical protein
VGAGLLGLLVLGANLYLWGAVPTVAVLSPALPLALAALSVAGWLLAPARAEAPPALPSRIAAPLLAVAALAAALVLRPTLGTGGPGGFYYSNNGEFSTYAAFADILLDRSAGVPIDLPVPTALSREGVMAVLCGVLARVLGIPPLLAVQPLAAVLAAMFFAGVALWLAAQLARADARPLGIALATVLVGGFLASATTQTVWTLSFVSQYAVFALLGTLLAWIPWATVPGASRRAKIIGAGVVGGVLASTALLTYPEMAFLVIGCGLLFALPRWGLDRRALALALAVGAGVALSTGPLGIRFLRDRMGSGLASGWDLFGDPEQPLAIATNLAGFTSYFWPGSEPVLLRVAGLAAFGALALWALACGARALVKDRRAPLGTAAIASLAFFAGTALLFTWVALDEQRSTYVAVKFTAAFLWIPVLAIAATAATAPRGLVAGLAAAAIAVVAAGHLAGGLAVARGIADDAEATRVGPWDLGVGARLIPPDESPYLLAPWWVRDDGTPEEIPKYHLDALYLWKGRIETGPGGRVMNHPAFQYTGQRWVISPHMREHGETIPVSGLPPTYVPVLERPGYSIYRQR